MHLSGFMQTFFGKMGIENLRFKPAYNPYTEVSDLPSLSYRSLTPPVASHHLKFLLSIHS